jgi:N-acyl-D-amino-acid deacylase
MPEGTVLIQGGQVVDGTGAPRIRADVVVRDGRIAAIVPTGGDMPSHAAAGRTDRSTWTIDATGMAVAPGFIDLHSHAGLWILHEPLHEPKIRQGVTTEVVGVDGLSYAPFPDRDDLEAMLVMNAGLDGRPPIALDWSTVADYLARFDERVSVNVALMVGNTALRVAALGWDDVPADERAIRDQRARLREAMEEGAFGVTSGLDYPPGAYATTEELAALANEAARLGGFYHTHVRYALGDRYKDPFREAIEIGRRGEAPAHITHFYHRPTYPGRPEDLLALVDDARASGHDVTYDSYPSEWASTRLLIMIPLWVQEGGPARTKERLADPAVRTRIRDELRSRGVMYANEGGLADVRLGAFTRPEHLPYEGRTLGEFVADSGTEPVDAICDLLLAEDLRTNQVTPGPHGPTLGPFIRHPVGMIGTDSVFIGAKPSPRTYGSFPRVLGQFVRDEALLSLEEAVRKMTAAPAARLGLRDRGVIRDGAIADLVVFDPRTVRSTATYEEPRSYPEGISHVLVAGRLVVDDGRHTGATPGRALRRGRD